MGCRYPHLRWKDYRIKRGDQMKVMRLATEEFIRRFLIHVLPDGFHRIRHYGLLASGARCATSRRSAGCSALLPLPRVMHRTRSPPRR